MKKEVLRQCGDALYGNRRWQTSLADDLGVADRTVRRWLAGDWPVPESVAGDLRKLIEARWRALTKAAKLLE